ncbi:uncharacterized protein LOC6038911 isoform X1 [Culex quinquefasciatus]|uniref:uncharacterized protein LOC6038911 isoform X1 n=1 Tax=Culex quinquefasciatus TaxID=7176 RepID=UPI0018E35F5C|nr:uncharacterized protein LOC6038911 isoform X1 [Culex quinquefasciatus]
MFVLWPYPYKSRVKIYDQLYRFVANQFTTTRLALLLVLSCTVLASAGKQKRLLYDLSDPLVTVTDSASYYHHNPSPSFHQPATIYSTSSLHHHHPELIKPIPAPFPAPSPSYISPKHSSSLDSIYKQHNYFDYSNYGAPFQFLGGNALGFRDDDTYIADGRILKQYSVLEHHPEEIERNRLLHSDLFAPSSSFFSGKPAPIYNQFTVQHLAPHLSTLGYNPRFGLPLNNAPSPLLTKNHGPVALGSGSIGIVHGPNGVALGSGSLGYISHQQHRDTLSDLVARKSRKHRPGPLHFGHNHD